jgi:hypothetical protein
MKKKNAQYKLLESQLGSFKGKETYKSEVTNEQIQELYERLKALEPGFKARTPAIVWRDELADLMAVTKAQLSNVIANNIRNESYRQDFIKKGEQLYKQLTKVKS